jgi:hypothetical protein
MVHQEVVRKSLKHTNKVMGKFNLTGVQGYCTIPIVRELIRNAYIQGVKDCEKDYERRVLNV